MSKFVQLQNPVTKKWERYDMKTGFYVGCRRKKYKCPVYGLDDYAPVPPPFPKRPKRK